MSAPSHTADAHIRRRWSVADDYLADPAVAPFRALLAALARRISSRRQAPQPKAQEGQLQIR